MAGVVPVVELSVVMHCEGCAGAVRKTIRRIPGVQSYTVDYTQQKALVVGTADPEAILSAIRKSGKIASLVDKGDASPAPAPPPPPPAAAAMPKAAPGQEEIKKADSSSEEKKDEKPRFSFRSKMPKLPNRPKMADMRKRMGGLKMADLQKKMPDLAGTVPKNFMTNACREFLTKGVFYAADEFSDSEDSVSVKTIGEPVKA